MQPKKAKAYHIPEWLETHLGKRKITLGDNSPLRVRIRERHNYNRFIKGEL